MTLMNHDFFDDEMYGEFDTETRINDADKGDTVYLKELSDEREQDSGAFAAHSPLKKIFELAHQRSGNVVAQAIVVQKHGLATIEEFHVDKDNYRRGYGSRLLTAIEDFARSTQASAIKTSFPSWGGPTLFHKMGYEEKLRLPLTTTINGRQQFDLTMAKVLG